MRWKEKEIIRYEIGTTRIMSGFLWLPVKLGGETRWLERASWVEQYKDNLSYDDRNPYWIMTEWTDYQGVQKLINLITLIDELRKK